MNELFVCEHCGGVIHYRFTVEINEQLMKREVRLNGGNCLDCLTEVITDDMTYDEFWKMAEKENKIHERNLLS